MPSFTYLHLPRFRFDDSSNLRWLYAIRVNRNLIAQFSFFFLPIYLFLLGKDQVFLNLELSPVQRGVAFIALYFLIARLTSLVLSVWLGKVICSMGMKWSFFWGHVFFIGLMGLLIWGYMNPQVVLWSAVVYGVQVHLYWDAYHTLISKLIHKKNLAENLGLLHFIVQLVSALTPAIGGLVAATYDYRGLFAISIFWSIFGAILSLRITDESRYSQPSWREFGQWLSEKRFIVLSISFFGRVFYDLALLIWPLYVFIILGTVEKVGFLYSASLTTALLMWLVVGYYIDHHRGRRPFLISGGALSVLWVLRSMAVNAWTIGFSDLLDKLVSNFHWMFFDTIMFKRGQGDKAFSYFIYREAIVSLAEMIFWLTAASVFLLSGRWLTIFGLGSIGVLLSLLIRDE